MAAETAQSFEENTGLLSIAGPFALGEVDVIGVDQALPSLDQVGRDDQGTIGTSLALLVQISLPVGPPSMLNVGYRLKSGRVIEKIGGNVGNTLGYVLGHVIGRPRASHDSMFRLTRRQ